MAMKKILAESLQEYKILNEDTQVIKGEIPTGLTVEDVDPKEFLVGLEVETRHSKELSVRRTLVLQNLSKNPKYYSEEMKGGLISNPAAINIYKKYFINKEKPHRTDNYKSSEIRLQK